MIDPEMIESLREPGFAKRVWGYDSYQVNALLAEIAERLEAAEAEVEAPPATEVAELTGVGEKVEEILAATRSAAELARSEAIEKATALTRESEEAAAQLRREADEYALHTRTAADQHQASTREEAERESKELREKAAVDAEARVAAAEEQAEQMLRDGRLELGRIEESIEDLRERRQLVITSIEEMQGRLSSMVGEAAEGTREFITLDPEDGSEEGTAILEADSESDTDGNGVVRDLPGSGEFQEDEPDGSEAGDETEEYATGDWPADGEDETIEAEADELSFVETDGDTDEQRIRGEDL